MALPISYNVRNVRNRWQVTLLAISGIGPAKLQLYGRALLDIVAGAPSSS